MYGAISVVSLLSAVAGVFLMVLGFVALVKLIQIAEDLRYLRSLKDSSVSRPKPAKYTVTVCLIVAGIIVLVVLGMAVGIYQGLPLV